MSKVLVVTLISIVLVLHSQAQELLIHNVNVINVKDGSTLRNVNVQIKDGRIEAITKKRISAKEVIDGKGKYLIPGLWDMHGHTWNSAQFFPLLIANGVTGIRDMFMNIDSIKTWRKQISEKKKIGPVIYAAGPIVDGPKPIWRGSIAAESVNLVPAIIDSLQNKLKVDFIKVYSSLPRDVYFKVAEVCKNQNIPFEGHLPNEISILEAARAGQRSLEHLYGFIPESSDSAFYLGKVLKGEYKDERLLNDRTARLEFQLRTFNPLKLSVLIDSLSKYDTWICPTLIVNKNIGYLNDSVLRKDERMKYMSPSLRAMWNPSNDFRFKTAGDNYFRLYRELFSLQLMLVKQLHENGIKLLAGTDYPNPYCFPGFSLHDELELLVIAGLTPLEALQTATLNPAQYFGITDDYGSVEVGKIANLILLNDDPLKVITNTKSIEAVIVNRSFLKRQDLNKLLQSVN